MLNLLLWAPLVAGLLALALPRAAAKWVVLLGTAVTLGLAIGLVADYGEGFGIQHVVEESWIPDLGVSYHLGVDGISVVLVLMTALLWVGAVAFAALRGYALLLLVGFAGLALYFLLVSS